MHLDLQLRSLALKYIREVPSLCSSQLPSTSHPLPSASHKPPAGKLGRKAGKDIVLSTEPIILMSPANLGESSEILERHLLTLKQQLWAQDTARNRGMFSRTNLKVSCRRRSGLLQEERNRGLDAG